MPTLRDRHLKPYWRILGQGDSGTGKTGSLVEVINNMEELGLERVVIADWDDGLDILNRCKPDKLDSVFFETLVDKTRAALVTKRDEKVNILIDDSPHDMAWSRGVRMMQQGIGRCPGSTEWGPETLFVCDSLSGQGDAAMNWARHQFGEKGDWKATGAAMGIQEQYLKMLIGLNCWVLVFAHIRYVGGGGEVVIQDNKGSSFKREIASAIHGRGHPSALGQQLPPKVARDFNIQLGYEMLGTMREIRTEPSENCTYKCPVELKDHLPQTTGLLEVMKELRASVNPNKNEEE